MCHVKAAVSSNRLVYILGVITLDMCNIEKKAFLFQVTWLYPHVGLLMHFVGTASRSCFLSGALRRD